MDFGVLGPLQVRSGETLIEIRRGLPRTILTYLLLRRGGTVTSSSLADTLWGDQQPMNPANALQTQISYLRSRFVPDPSRPMVLTRPGGYSLDVEAGAIDACRFEQAARVASHVDRNDPAMVGAALRELESALALWRGPALADVAGEDFAVGEAARLEEVKLGALEVRCELGLLLGQHRELAADLAALVGQHPFRERFHHQLMLALYRSGRQAEALRAFADARENLVDMLGIEPGAPLRELERRILEQDPALDSHLRSFEGAGRAGLPGPLEHVESTEQANVPGFQHRARLPAGVSALVGREAELQRVATMLHRSRIVTLTGPAGAGKTRLAIETARDVSARGHVWFVYLGDVAEPAQVATRLASALDIALAPQGDMATSVAMAMAGRRGLLVLDTCEHVVGAVASLTGQLLREAADVRVLATSRRPLNVTGEIAWPVPPLAMAPMNVIDVAELSKYGSIELFVDRASAVRADFELSEDNAADVAAICMTLDGLPLAIEMAAARVDVLSPGAIRERLLRRFDLLVDGGRDVPPRQRTLRNAVEWSVGMLDEGQRAFFAQLGVFAGSFDLAAASCVVDVDDAAALELMTSLVRHSMVTVVDQDRYRLLDTLGAYALEMLADLDADASHARHAECYLKRALLAEQGVQGAEQVYWLRQVREDFPNHRLALQWLVSAGDGVAAARLAGALGWPWVLDGMLADADRELQQVLRLPDLPPLERSKLLWSLALLASSRGQMQRAEALAHESVECGRRADDPVQTACGLNALAVVQWAVGDLEGSQSTRDQAIALFEQSDALWGLAVCRVLQTRTSIDRGTPDAGDLAEQGLAAARDTTDQHLISIALEQVARLHLRAGRAREAVVRATASLEAAESIGYPEGILGALHLLGAAMFADGQPEPALRHHVRALGVAAEIGHPAAMCEAVEGVACVSAHQGRMEEAAQLLRATDAERALKRIPRRAEDVATVPILREDQVASIDVASIDERNRPSRTPPDEIAFDEIVRGLLGDPSPSRR